MKNNIKKHKIMKKEEPYIKAEVYEKLPQELKKLTENFEGREKDIVLLSSIGVLSNCFPKIKGEYDNRILYPQLYVMIIAPPASGKGVMEYSRLLLKKIDDDFFSKTKEEREECKRRNKGKFLNCPEIECKILPANISSSQMYNFLSTSQDGVLIMESEADTLSNALKKEWGDFSDVLRKVFHHESLSISRKTDDLNLKISNPKLAMVIAGTPNQLKSVIKSKEDGLYSRFMIYSFDDISEFKNPFESKGEKPEEILKKTGELIYETYMKLKDLETEIVFKFTEEQVKIFMKKFPLIRNRTVKVESRFVSNVHRHGVILFRIAMVLTALRNREKLHLQKELLCSDDDFEIALSIVNTSLSHSFKVFNSFDNSGLPQKDYELLVSFPTEFTTQEAYKKGEDFGVNNRVVIDKLRQWQDKGYIEKVEYGIYQKRV